VGKSKLSLIRSGNPTLADGLQQELERLEQQIQVACQNRPNGRIEMGFDYVVTAELS
jgi:hypothetical protein